MMEGYLEANPAHAGLKADAMSEMLRLNERDVSVGPDAQACHGHGAVPFAVCPTVPLPFVLL